MKKLPNKIISLSLLIGSNLICICDNFSTSLSALEYKNSNVTDSIESAEKVTLKRTLSDQEISDAENFSVDYKKFLNESKTEKETVNYVLKKAKRLGYIEFDVSKKYKPGDKIYLVNRNRNIILCVIGKNNLKNGIRFSVAHVDSPHLDLKPSPVISSDGLISLKTHYYGGIKKYQWTTIPLALHGTVVKKSGEVIDITIGEDESDPCFCITDLLPHLASSQMRQSGHNIITGENLNALAFSIQSDSEKDLADKLIKNSILKKYDISKDDFFCADLELVPNFKARDVGLDRSMIGGYGQDDRSCAYCSVEALFNLKTTPENTSIVFLTDKEETGSCGNTGITSKFFKNFISDLASQYNLKSRHVLSRSKCLSADVTAMYDPNFASEFDFYNSSFINKGVSIAKYTGCDGKCNTSEASAEFLREIVDILDNNNILWQTGEMGKVDNGGGGTVALYVASYNVDVLDIGVPILSMHSPFEIISKTDLYMTYRALHSFFEFKD